MRLRGFGLRDKSAVWQSFVPDPATLPPAVTGLERA